MRPDRYDLDGNGDNEERECLVKISGGWEVYIPERGKKKCYVKFDTESEACFEVLKRLT